MDEPIPLPAVCDGCSTVFTSGYALSGSANFSGDNKSGPCPACGGMGTVPNGIYSVVDRVLSVAPALNPSLRDLIRLRELLSDQGGTFDPDILTARAQQVAPSAAPLLNVLRDPAFANVVGLLGLLVALAALIVSMQGS